MNRILIFLLCFSALFSCSDKKPIYTEDEGMSAFSADSLRAHISVLASDDYEGRKPFSAGEKKTVGYLEQQFIALGLEPGNGSSYFQEVPMVRISATASPVMKISSPAANIDLKGR